MNEVRRYDDYQALGYDTVWRTCLHVATVLGDLLQTELTVVGGLVPSLLIPQSSLPAAVEAHCGTLDVDLGLSLALLDEQLYAEISARLREAGFAVGEKTEGQVTRQTWRTPEGLPEATIDFLIPMSQPGDRPGGIRHLESDFAAIIMPGLQLVARDWQPVALSGRTLREEVAERTVRVCGPGAFMVLKARAFRNRGKEKDAYDLVYVLKNHGGGPEHVAEFLAPLLDDPDAKKAVEWLTEDFATLDSLGPVRAALFRYGVRDDYLQRDAHAVVQALLRKIT